MQNLAWTRDELILALDLYFRINPSQMDAKHQDIIELSRVLNELLIHRERPDGERFRNPNGVSMKLNNFKRFDPNVVGKGLERGGKLEEEIWNEFAIKKEELSQIANNIKLVVHTNSDEVINRRDSDEEEAEFPEGRVLYRSHKYRERDQKVVRLKKQQAAQNNNLICEVCRFDFFKVYGSLGEGYIECHHTVPVSEYQPGDKTKIQDLALVCANCDRMLHRRTP